MNYSTEPRLFVLPFDSKIIPPVNLLRLWQNQIRAAEKIASGKFYITTDIGNIGIEQVLQFQTLHTVITTKISATQDVDWFNDSCLKPKAKGLPSPAALKAFRSLLMHSPSKNIINDFGMTPNEMSMICGKRYISGDYVRWIVNQLNKQ